MSVLVVEETVVSLDQMLWQAWMSMDVPEGFRAEIIEGTITLSPTGGTRHFSINRRLSRALYDYLDGTGYGPAQDGNVIAGLKVLIPDVFVAPDDVDEIEHPDGVGLLASGVALVAETVSPGAEARKRDHVLKHRAYATAGIPVYVIIDDHEEGGCVTVLTDPDVKRRAYKSSIRVPYGKEVVIPEGPAKGFVIGPEITGERRD